MGGPRRAGEVWAGMRLWQVMAGTEVHGPRASDPEITLLTCDSREVVPGALFFALPGEKQDGRLFADEAVRRGAAAVLAEGEVDCAPALALRARSARRAMAIAAHNFYGHPGEGLSLAAVTGTNGKTTVTYLVEACARAEGVPAAVLGTVGYRWPGGEARASHTTPESTEIARILARARAGGARLAVLEASSHALAQERVTGLAFESAAFMNLSRDHLDYHRDMERYFRAKSRLFEEHLRPGGTAVVNVDDPFGARLAHALEGRPVVIWRFGASRENAIFAEGARFSVRGIEATLRTPKGDLALASPLIGVHNLENLLAASGLALACGLSPQAVERGLSASQGAPGRLERIEGRGIVAFVDYAHTPDALARALAALRALGPRRLLLVFGCGGDRDRGKRPLMGEVAAKACELSIATSDNPRSEDPLRILSEIVPGLERAGAGPLTQLAARAGERGYLVCPDRREAIKLALELARPGDLVLIAGKGHEDYEIVGRERRPFDDRVEARRALGVAA